MNSRTVRLADHEIIERETMIASMTAFGRIQEQGDWGHAVLEIRTVNHRYLEISLRIPDDLRMLENKIRERISMRLKRGKVDFNLRFEADVNVLGDISINTKLATKLVQAAELLPIYDQLTSAATCAGLRRF